MSTELRLRIISALVLGAAVLAATYWGGLVFTLLAILISLLIFHEWSSMAGFFGTDRFAFAYGWICVLLVAWETYAGNALSGLLLLLGFTLGGVIACLIRRKPMWLPAGIFYAGLSGLSLAHLRGVGHDGLITILFLFAIVWGTDILAYFVGRAIGGPKLAPSISPGKTWSGAIGGAVAGTIAGCLVIYFAGADFSVWLPLIALVLSAFSQIGDLFESWVKRRFGVKDSSHLIPGHGGVMDRVDGLVFACFLTFLGGMVLAATSGNLFGTIALGQ
jgi:phosphatidate cytidylyltransferase